ncbi:MAG TPA: VPLPA-CTERM sorting domain-containing protein [Nitrospira sp.]|nr:VPLPA-CTERM sorting domain-containing protein [Nitrospira sp.]MCW5796556.1 VPLPA-CTERM sorting domain-containing protein [Nitrospira sp.]HMU31741.1 VPLPA-CTERM sorting domain-containing protein [Nitrospira sp.]HMV57650.1 VPLPA-CTERM sorting domain-containing protein [Nitrospira sp.]HMW87605.1 VPLPA-CTERM sorting domain-containing protein [Nitrospira sp.]
MKTAWMALLALCAVAQTGEAALIGTDVMFQSVFQATSTSPEFKLTSLNTVTVKEPGVEFPSLKALQVSNPSGLRLVDIAINIGDTFIDMNFTNSAPDFRFASGFRNGYKLTFDNAAMPSIRQALIDRTVTTLGLSDSDVTFSGNTLQVNVESLPFNTSTFARINLTVEGGPSPVPVPAAAWLFGSGLAALVALKRSGA